MNDLKIVVLDGYTLNPGDLSWQPLEQYGELTVYDRTKTEEETIERIGDTEAIFTNKTPITPAVIENCPNLKFIGVLATGYNVVDTTAAKKRGITVCNVPTYGTAAVAQYSIALLLEICCHIGHHSRTVKEGRWEKCDDWCYWDYPLIELQDKTIGIIGFGRIGRQEGAVSRALGMNVLANDPYPTDAGREIADYVELDELYKKSDVISLHCNLTDDNYGMINGESISKMKDNVIIINNSRGQLVNERDLADALNEGRVQAAGLDVVSTEPIMPDNPLLKAKNCIITPHISWASLECRDRIMNISADNLKGYLDGVPVNVVL